jgi:hypothetical protein
MALTIDDIVGIEEAAINALRSVTHPLVAMDRLAAITDERPRLQIDLTDPPSPVVVRVAGVEASGPTADQALCALCDAVAATLSETRAKAAAAKAMADVAAALAKSMTDAVAALAKAVTP